MFELSSSIKIAFHIQDKTNLPSILIDQFTKVILKTERGTLYHYPYCIDWIKLPNKKTAVSVTETNHETF